MKATVDALVIGAGITGLGFANAFRERNPAASCLVLEAESEPGGYCRTIQQDGFTWDYSGHFFHFKHPEIEAWLRSRMPGEDIVTIEKKSFIHYAGRHIDFPFQKNIHQLPQAEFIECLVDLYFREAQPKSDSFLDMLYAKLGKSITEKFLRPYNEKLYACSLNDLDASAMGRFFPDAKFEEIIANMKAANNASYNSTFTYPRSGAMAYVRALLRDVPSESVRLNERVLSIDAARHTVETNRGVYTYKNLISSAPLPALLQMLGRPEPAQVFTGNQVSVWNLGFDKKGTRDVHWIYYPDPRYCFYRVGFYDNMFPDDERMSLYVEVSSKANAAVDAFALREKILADLRLAGVITDQQLISSHTVTMNPAYAHITQQSIARSRVIREELALSGIHAAGRYGRWTYCSIEDNLLEARELALMV